MSTIDTIIAAGANAQAAREARRRLEEALALVESDPTATDALKAERQAQVLAQRQRAVEQSAKLAKASKAAPKIKAELIAKYARHHAAAVEYAAGQIADVLAQHAAGIDVVLPAIPEVNPAHVARVWSEVQA